MFFKLSKNSSVKNILVISLTNIGDVLMNCPVLDVLHRDFPKARLYVIVGPKAISVFKNHPFITTIVYDKHASWIGQLRWFFKLAYYSFDVIVDLRNTILPYFLMARYKTLPNWGVDKSKHLVQQHLARLHSLYPFESIKAEPSSIYISPSDKLYVDSLLNGFIKEGERLVVIAPRAADSAKTWEPQGFAEVGNALIREHQLKIILVGAASEAKELAWINTQLSHQALDLSGKTDLVQVAEILKRSALAIVHDSGIMHIASYLNIPTIALFGPTDPKESRPWGERYQVVQRNDDCPRCRNRRLEVLHKCMSGIKSKDVLIAYQNL